MQNAIKFEFKNHLLYFSCATVRIWMEESRRDGIFFP